MTTKRFRRRGLALGAVLVSVSGLLARSPAGALPPGAPKTGMVCTTSETDTFNLVANSGTIQTPDGNTVFMWSYANGDAPDNGSFQYPGPVLCVTEGHTVTINLTNDLPEPSSIVFPGQDSEVAATGGSAGLLTSEAAGNGGAATYSFTASAPGTYLYESGSDIAKQIEMGLYGALIVRPSLGDDFAYDRSSTRFDPSREYLLLLAEIDPDLHHAVEEGETYDFTAKHNRYFTINGRSFPDTIQDNGTPLLPTQPYGALVRIQPTSSSSAPALVRMINAGVDNHPFHPHGNHLREIAQDGRPLLDPSGTQSASTERYGETIGAGQTRDFLLRWDNRSTDTAGVVFNDDWNPNTNPLPVAGPNYRNVAFRDNSTWYAGTPYLGYKGTLPVGEASLNVCGEWYFPFHSHALNEFTNFDEGFGGMGTLLRVDPAGGCFAAPTAATLVGGALKSGKVSALELDDGVYYQIKPKTTTTTTATTIGQTTGFTVKSASGFPVSGTFYIRVDTEVMQVTGGQGTKTWTVTRGQLGTAAATHASGATVSALATDWYTTFSDVTPGAANLKLTYKGKDCGSISGNACVSLTTNLPEQTVQICDWTISGAAGCSTSTSNGWVTLPAPQAFGVGSSDVSTTWTVVGPWSRYIGTGTNKGKVRVLIHTQRWTAPDPTVFSTWGTFMQLVYDAP